MESDKSREAMYATNFILPLMSNKFCSSEMIIYARLNSNFDNSRVDETKRQLKHLLKEVRKTRKLQTLDTEHIEEGIPLSDDEDSLKIGLTIEGFHIVFQVRLFNIMSFLE